MNKLFSKVLFTLLAVFSVCLSTAGTAKADNNFKELTPPEAENAADIETAIADNAAYAGGTVSRVTTDGGKTLVSSSDDYFTFTLPEDGIVYLRYSMVDSADSDNLDARFILCGDEEMTNAKADGVDLLKTGYESQIVYLKKGTYYIKCLSTAFLGSVNSSGTNTVGVAAAYIPVSGKLNSFKVDYSTKATTTGDVVCTVTTADPDALVWMQPEAQSSSLVDNEFRWTAQYECPDKTFTISKNGKYTVRIQTSLDTYSQEVITISNIDRSKPKTPTVSSFKAGMTKITGTADAGTVVYIKYGSTNKTVTARDNKTYSLTVPAVKSGTKITVYAKDFAGNKSQAKTYTVK